MDHITDSLRELLGSFARKKQRSEPTATPPGIVAAGEMEPACPVTPLEVRPQRIPLSVPHMGGKELQNVSEAFASNWLSTAGPNLQALEERVGELAGQPPSLDPDP